MGNSVSLYVMLLLPFCRAEEGMMNEVLICFRLWAMPDEHHGVVLLHHCYFHMGVPLSTSRSNSTGNGSRDFALEHKTPHPPPPPPPLFWLYNATRRKLGRFECNGNIDDAIDDCKMERPLIEIGVMTETVKCDDFKSSD